MHDVYFVNAAAHVAAETGIGTLLIIATLRAGAHGAGGAGVRHLLEEAPYRRSRARAWTRAHCSKQ